MEPVTFNNFPRDFTNVNPFSSCHPFMSVMSLLTIGAEFKFGFWKYEHTLYLQASILNSLIILQFIPCQLMPLT